MIRTPASIRSSATGCARLGRHGEDADDDVLVADDVLEAARTG